MHEWPPGKSPGSSATGASTSAHLQRHPITSYITVAYDKGRARHLEQTTWMFCPFARRG